MLKKLFLPLFALTLLGGAFLASNPTYAVGADPCANVPEANKKSCQNGPEYKKWQFELYNCSSYAYTNLDSCNALPSERQSNCFKCKTLKDQGYHGPDGTWQLNQTVKKTCEDNIPSVFSNNYAKDGLDQWLLNCYKQNGLDDGTAKNALEQYKQQQQQYQQQKYEDGEGGTETEQQKQPVWDEMSGKENYYVPNTAPTVKSECRPFLGLVSWDCNTEFQDVSDEEDISRVVVMIAINIFTDITVLASYLVIGYIIYGGYLYIFANGDVGKVSTGKKALNQAFIGLAITLSAHIIVNAIRVAFMHNNGSFEACATGECVDADTLVSGLIQWVVGIGGAVAAVFVVGGGIMYITSAGDPNKLQLAKNVIKYALIGLVIVALAEIITGFMTNVIVDAKNSSGSGEETSYINNIKEYYENQKVS